MIKPHGQQLKSGIVPVEAKEWIYVVPLFITVFNSVQAICTTMANNIIYKSKLLLRF